MAWSAPSTRSTGYVASAANWNEIVNDVLWLGNDMPHARVYNTANLAIPNSTITALTFNSERYDTGGCHSTASNTSRLTVPSGGGGVYHLGASVNFASNATGTRAAAIRLNGATTLANVEVGAQSGTLGLVVSCDYKLSAGDYVEVTVYQASGGSLNVTTNSSFSPEFWFRWVAAS